MPEVASDRFTSAPLILGWREWVGLPGLGLPVIKAKVDTGARTSALHAFEVTTETRGQQEIVCFSVHPLQHRGDLVVQCEAPLVDRRIVSDSGGHREQRFVIAAELLLADQRWLVELTLTDRDTMRFRMLIGRTALAGRALVDPRRSFAAGHCANPGAAYKLGKSR
jgi:hypothetical protein